ncbi:MAG: lipoate--protein ligase family protein [Verrucomicrobia bacterium]|nr:lipoate--protein ligase family protein [Verrucomicrobiota bacterium]
MKCLDLTFPTPAENLACDEALLDWGDESGEQALRFWEPAQHFVVVGYANKVAVEVNTPACAAAGVPIYRRCSGGGTVLQGPGCLNYSLVLQVPEHGWLASISGANQFIMHRHREAVEAVLACSGGLATAAAPTVQGEKLAAVARPPPRVEVCGHTDLALDGHKFSGNAQRRKRRALLFHGTFLWNLDLPLIGKFLRLPSKQPAYRQGRPHTDFVMNLAVSPALIKAALRAAWQADEELASAPTESIARLATEKYSTATWNWKF